MGLIHFSYEDETVKFQRHYLVANITRHISFITNEGTIICHQKNILFLGNIMLVIYILYVFKYKMRFSPTYTQHGEKSLFSCICF